MTFHKHALVAALTLFALSGVAVAQGVKPKETLVITVTGNANFINIIKEGQETSEVGRTYEVVLRDPTCPDDIKRINNGGMGIVGCNTVMISPEIQTALLAFTASTEEDDGDVSLDDVGEITAVDIQEALIRENPELAAVIPVIFSDLQNAVIENTVQNTSITAVITQARVDQGVITGEGDTEADDESEEDQESQQEESQEQVTTVVIVPVVENTENPITNNENAQNDMHN